MKISHRSYIPYSRQSINLSDIKSVSKALSCEFITQGKTINLFEGAINNFCKSKYSVVVNSATSALHLACLSLGLKTGDLIWTSPISFVASANCALYCGAKVDFVDIDSKTWSVSADKLYKKIKQYLHQKKKLPKIFIPVHFAGQSCDMKEIKKICNRYKIKIIEDASHALGGSYKNLPVGSSKYSDITIFSFHPVKTITTGEGGAIVTNNLKIANKIKLLRSHGITRSINEMKFKPKNFAYYEQIDLGFNYRMTDFQAALGVSQLKKANQFVKKRNILAKRYERYFSNSNLLLQSINDGVLSARHLFVIRVNSKIRDKLMNQLKDSNIGANIHYNPIHLQPYYRKLGFRPNDFPNAEKYSKEAISIPLFVGLTASQQDKVIKTINDFLSKNI